MQEVLEGTIMFYIKTKLRTYKAVEQTLNTKLFPVCFYFLLLFKGYVVRSESTVAYSVQYVCVNIRKHIFTDIDIAVKQNQFKIFCSPVPAVLTALSRA